jgi:hypothetical protein
MKYNAYRLTGDARSDTAALKAWRLGVTVTDEDGQLAVEVNNPGYWLTGCCGYRWRASVGNLVVFPVDERNPMLIHVVPEVTADDAPKNGDEL